MSAITRWMFSPSTLWKLLLQCSVHTKLSGVLAINLFFHRVFGGVFLWSYGKIGVVEKKCKCVLSYNKKVSRNKTIGIRSDHQTHPITIKPNETWDIDIIDRRSPRGQDSSVFANSSSLRLLRLLRLSRVARCVEVVLKTNGVWGLDHIWVYTLIAASANLLR